MKTSAPATFVSHYDLLGVSQTASKDEIVDAETALRKVYEARSKQGDTSATEMTRRLNDAYQVLSDEHKRADYDRDPRVLARSYIDVAYSLPIGRFAKLDAVASWMSEAGARDTSTHAVTLADVMRPDPLLDGDGQ